MRVFRHQCGLQIQAAGAYPLGYPKGKSWVRERDCPSCCSVHLKQRTEGFQTQKGLEGCEGLWLDVYVLIVSGSWSLSSCLRSLYIFFSDRNGMRNSGFHLCKMLGELCWDMLSLFVSLVGHSVIRCSKVSIESGSLHSLHITSREGCRLLENILGCCGQW